MSTEEEGRRLASQREDLIAQGVDPAELLVPKFIDERVAHHQEHLDEFDWDDDE